MKIKHADVIIDKENPYLNCKLERKQYAENLTSIVDTYADGFVLAINNEWGTGKTTFVKMWQQYLDNKKFKTIYFNAWENDFDHNPLVAIMSELKELTNTSNEELFKSIVKKGAILSKHILPALLKALSKKYILDTDIVLDAIENATEGATEIFEEEIKEYTNKKQIVKEFREELEKFVEKTENKKPIIFIIDELDRCRPNYAVELLEQMKHFFSVKGIVFVLSIDKIQLSYAINGFYGSDKINSNEYLRRFIDLEYSIPQSSVENFCKYLYEYYSFNDIFEERTADDKTSLLRMSVILFRKDNVTLRQQEKIYGFVRLVVNSFEYNQYMFPELLFILVYMKIMTPELYSKLEKGVISLQELSDKFSEIVFDGSQNLAISLLYIEAMLLHFYNNSQNFHNKNKLIEKNEQGEIVAIVKSKLDNEPEHNSLGSCLEDVSKDINYRDVSLSYLLKKINLIEPLRIN